jgi:threonine-phosphate decarboxylase
MEETGGKWIEGKDGEKIWDCSGCSIVHRKHVVSKIKRSMRQIIKEESENEY